MTRILMRGGKSPFETISYEDTLARNILGTNSGNLIFAESVWRMLSTSEARLSSYGYRARPETAAEINVNYDVMVLPFANAFRRSFLPHLRKYTALIEQLNIPAVVTGVGAQAPLIDDGTAMAEMREDVGAFCKAVLARSASIGVRGEYTAEFLRSLGFDHEQIDIIGCPSMFYHGPDFPEVHKKEALLETDLVSMNVSPYVPRIAEHFERNYAAYPRLMYVPQNNESLDQILWNGSWLPNPGNVFPKSTDHPMFRDDRLRFFIDTRTWIDHLRSYDFVFGTRIHGNVMGLLAGTPSFVLAHDSRTLELARYFDIPHLPMTEVTDNMLAGDLYARADYGPMRAGHQARFERWLAFLEKNNLAHVYQTGEDQGAAFDTQLASVTFPAEMPTLPHQTSEQTLARAMWRKSNTPSVLGKIMRRGRRLMQTKGKR